MFEYLPNTEAVSSDFKEKLEKKPLIVRLAVFRIIAAILILAVMMLMRTIFPQESEELSDEFETSLINMSEGDRMIYAAADVFWEYINRSPSENENENA